MKRTKRLVSLLLAVFVLAAWLPFSASAATESPVREAEPNNTIAVANSIELDSEVIGACAEKRDEDWFVFTLPEDGMVQLSFSHEYVDSGAPCWETAYFTASNEKIGYDDWNGNGIVTEKGIQMGLQAGVYYLRVAAVYYYQCDNKDYKFSVNYTPSDFWEKEINNIPPKATPVELEKKYSGSSLSRDDDWYSFTLDSPVKFEILFEHDYVDTDGSMWNTKIFKEEDVNHPVFSDGWRGKATSVEKSKEINLSAGNYFIRINPVYDHLAKGQSYHFVLQKIEEKKPAPTSPFWDVPSGSYYYTPVLWAVENKITSGTDSTHFSPNASCTRSQAVTFLWRAAGEPEPQSAENPFTDVKPGDFFYKAVLWAKEQKITSGTSATKFSPNDRCTRGQIVTFQYRAAGTPDSGGGSAFSDVSSSSYCYDAVKWAVANGITQGSGNGKFSPDDTCNRGQIVTFLYRQMK